MLERRLPAWTSWITPGASKSLGRSASGRAVVPPLAWPMMSQPRASTSSIVTGDESGIDAPPVWFITTKPFSWAARTSGAASACGVKSPKPTLASQTPFSFSSAKSSGSRVGSMITEPAITLTPPGRKFSKARWAATASAFTPSRSLGRPGKVNLGGGHHRGDPAMHRGLDPAEGALSRGPVTEDDMGVGVDQPGADHGTAGIEHRVRIRARARSR